MELHKLLVDLCNRARLNKIPKLTVCRDMVAQSWFNRIRIGRKLCPLLTENEMKGVIAHEVHHATNFGKQIATFILLLVPSLVVIAVVELIGYIALISKFPMLPYYPSTSILLVIILLSFLLYSIGFSRHESRARELEADRFAASIVGGTVFMKALGKLERVKFDHGTLSGLKEWLCPHPPLSKRLEAIRNVKRLPRPAKQVASDRGKSKPEQTEHPLDHGEFPPLHGWKQLRDQAVLWMSQCLRNGYITRLAIRQL